MTCGRASRHTQGHAAGSDDAKLLRMAERLPSLEVVRDQVRIELDLQFRHFDALDSKAGVVLGFSGAIVAISAGRQGPWQ